MGLRLDLAKCAKEHPELAGVLRAELRKVSRDVKTLNVKFKLNGVKILDSYLNEVDDTTSGQVAMSGTIGIRMGMGGWREWVFKGVFDVVQAQSGDINLHNTRGPLLSKDTQVTILLEDILVEQIGGKLVDMLSRHALKWGNTSESQDEVMGGQVFKGASTKTAGAEFSDMARAVGRALKAKVIPVPFNRVKDLKNYRDPRLQLDPDAPQVAYILRDIPYSEETMLFDEHGDRHDLEIDLDALLVPCEVKSNGRKAVLVLTYFDNPINTTAYDEDYDVEPYTVASIVKGLRNSLSTLAWADHESRERPRSSVMASTNRSAEWGFVPPTWTRDERRYFKGPGLQALRAMNKGFHPKWGHLANAIESFEKYEALRQKPGWEDPEQLKILQGGLAKLRGYMKGLYPTGKPKPKKKKTPRAIFLEQMEYPEVKSLIKKFSRIFKGKPAEAGQFAFDVLEDANFHREGGNMNVAMADYSGITKVAPSSVAMKLGWDSTVLPFAVGLMSGAGDKRGAAQMIKTFVQMNKDWYVEAV